jgi:hypothetical protein
VSGEALDIAVQQARQRCADVALFNLLAAQRANRVCATDALTRTNLMRPGSCAGLAVIEWALIWVSIGWTAFSLS